MHTQAKRIKKNQSTTNIYRLKYYAKEWSTLSFDDDDHYITRNANDKA